MKLSTKGRYGVRAMLELAINYGKGPILLKEIAERQEISNRYLEHLMTRLKAAMLVKSIRGARGGYVLAKPPSQTRLSEVIQVLEGSMAPLECVDTPEVCSRSSYCVTRDVWRKTKRATIDILESTTLQGLVEKQREKLRQALTYYI